VKSVRKKEEEEEGMDGHWAAGPLLQHQSRHPLDIPSRAHVLQSHDAACLDPLCTIKPGQR